MSSAPSTQCAADADGGPCACTADLLTVAFGATVAMWTVCYVARLPAVMAPTWLLGCALLACLFGAGVVIGRYSQRTWRGGMGVGLIATVLNLLILGSLIMPETADANAPSPLLWLPGTMLASAAIAAVGAAVGASRRSRRCGDVNWTGLFALVALAATGVLLIAGGLVTGFDAGLSVPDWPASFKMNMFLYPLGRMTGHIYFEHAHRLYGALVGLTTIALAVYLWRADGRRWVRRVAVLAVIAVVVQGVLGGLRVTEATGAADTGIEIAGPEHENLLSATLRVAHGVFGQVFLMLIVALAVGTSRTWRLDGPPRRRSEAGTDRGLCIALVVALLGQLLLGALVRHIHHGLMLHMTIGVLVAMLLLAVGLRLWGLSGDDTTALRRLGAALIFLMFVQIVLGTIAAIATGMSDTPATPTAVSAAVTTAHQGVGAALLACATALSLFTHRLLDPAEQS